jgi:glycerophosphoryl diester phosphodiesterase
MSRSIAKYIALALLLLSSCTVDISNVPIDQTGIDQELAGCTALPQSAKTLLNGIYEISDGKSDFGPKSVLKWSGDYLSIFNGKNASYMILQAGVRGSEIILAGYWRFSQGNETGRVSLKIAAPNGASDLLSGKKPSNIIISGDYFTDMRKNLTMKYIDSLKSKQFWIIGHRGGGRNIDRLPASENSLEMIKFAERLGANSIEIDVRLTKDSVPVLFHDIYMSKRLIQQDYFIGQISDYTFPQLRTFCTLKKGEFIPTLREAFETVLYKTNLELIWMDIKNQGTLSAIAPIQKEYIDKAKQIGRKLEILIGIADEDIFNDYLNLPDYTNYPALCELDEDYVGRSKSQIWAPRWSLGLLNERVGAIHTRGKRVFIWTLDEPKFIKTYIDKGLFDGILSNYPFLVAYEFYTN